MKLFDFIRTLFLAIFSCRRLAGLKNPWTVAKFVRHKQTNVKDVVSCMAVKDVVLFGWLGYRSIGVCESVPSL